MVSGHNQWLAIRCWKILAATARHYGDDKMNGNEHTALGHVLFLLKTAHLRCTSIEGIFAGWATPYVNERAVLRSIETARSRGATVAAMNDPNAGFRHHRTNPPRVSHRHRFQATLGNDTAAPPDLKIRNPDTNKKPRWPHSAWPTVDLRRMLAPFTLLSDSTFTFLRHVHHQGRAAYLVDAHPRLQWHESADRQVWENDHARRLTIDAETGIILHSETWFDSLPHSGTSLHDLVIKPNNDPPDSTNHPRYETAIHLLYSAQWNFPTVHATIECHHNGVRWTRQILASRPDQFREQSLSDAGIAAQSAHYNGITWTKTQYPEKRVTSNAPPDQLMPLFDSHSVSPALDESETYYGIFDGQKAITAEHMLNPSFLLTPIEPLRIEQSSWLGRPTIEIEARHAYGVKQVRSPFPVDRYRLSIDAEYGCLLFLNSSSDQTSGGHRITKITYGEEATGEYRPPPTDRSYHLTTVADPKRT